MRREAEGLIAFARGIKAEGFSHVVLLGMGGSSLGPEVFRQTYGVARGYPEFRVLSSIHPAEIMRMERSVALTRTLFIVASKSGATLETQCLARYFLARVRAVIPRPRRPGTQFLALTNPGSPLAAFAKAHQFRKVFLTSPQIGGRYAALSFTGLVPAAFMGLDLDTLLDHAVDAAADHDDAVELGAVLGGLGTHGRDKVTFVLAPALASFGSWAEQLLAESTSKRQRGLIPVQGETLGAPRQYGRDRLFVSIEMNAAADTGAVARRHGLAALERAGHPVIRIRLGDAFDLAGEFFRWEVATAVAGTILKVNPFDEPDVAASKVRTRRLLTAFRLSHRLPARRPLLVDRGCRVYAPTDYSARTLATLLPRFLGQARRTGAGRPYVAIMAYLDRSPRHEELLQRLRVVIRDRYRVATTLGYGPSLLHSTGQLHKGGPPTGLFLQITAPEYDHDDKNDLPVPGERYSFSTLARAGALGDYLALATRGRRVIEIQLGRTIAGGLRRCLDALA